MAFQSPPRTTSRACPSAPRRDNQHPEPLDFGSDASFIKRNLFPLIENNEVTTPLGPNGLPLHPPQLIRQNAVYGFGLSLFHDEFTNIIHYLSDDSSDEEED